MDTGRWRARYRGPDKRERLKDFDRKVDAVRWLREQTAKMDRGEWTDPAAGRVTVGDYAKTWLDTKVDIKHSTRVSYDSLLREQVLPTWADVSLAEVRHEDVAAWVGRMHSTKLSASRTRQSYIVLNQVLNLAVESRRIPSNPANKIKLPKLPTSSERPFRALDERQVWAVAEATGQDRLSFLVLAWCGLRFGELAGMRVRNFDVLRRELRVEVTLSEIGGHLIEGSPKTSASVRRVPVPVWLVEELMPALEGKGPDDRLLTGPGGGDLRIGNWRSRVFDPAVRAAGVARQVAGDMVRPHDLRHTCASLHIKYGTPPKVLSEMLGHASVSFTQDVYGHLFPGDAHSYVDRLGEVALESRAVWVRSESSDRVVTLSSVAGGKGL